jgi:hypothetical protein
VSLNTISAQNITDITAAIAAASAANTALVTAMQTGGAALTRPEGS